MQMYDNFFNEENFAFRETAKKFAEEVLRPITMEIDRTDDFPDEVAQKMVELGFLGIKIPKEYGGLGQGVRSYISVMEEVAKGTPTATLYISSANSLSSAPIILFGTDAQKKKYLPGIVDNTAPVAFGLTEPGAGSDASGLQTRAVRDGDEYVLNGTKCFITFAPKAKYTVVFAKTDPAAGTKGISSFLVDMDLPGVSTGKHEEKLGQRGVPVSDVVLEDVRVPADCLLGEEGKGFINAMQTLDLGRVGVSSMSLGIAQRVMDLTIARVKSAIGFDGKPLARAQGIQFMLADMEARLNAARVLLYNTAYVIDSGMPSTKQASMTKLFVSETCQAIVDKCVCLFEGEETPEAKEVEKLWRDIRINTIYEGSSEVQRMVVSSNLLR